MTRTTKQVTIGIAAMVLAGCVAKLNGKTYGLGAGDGSGGGSSRAEATAPSSSSSSAASARGDDTVAVDSDDRPRATGACHAPAASSDQPPFASAPADPWVAVQGDQPVRLLGRVRFSARGEGDCSAKHDHCLRDCAWFRSTPHFESGTDVIETDPVLFTESDSLASPSGGSATDVPVVYRTVPATRRNLRPGVVVVAVSYPKRRPMGELRDEHRDSWRMGRLEQVDWTTGKAYLKNLDDPVWLSAARVAVLRYPIGGKVEILDGRTRDELAVRLDELIMPTAEATVVRDPWAQVGADGQPREATDTVRLESVNTCGAAQDHCLRPWVWLVDVGGERLWPAIYQRGQFHTLEAIDRTKPLAKHQGAYRTVPAVASRLKPGQKVFLPRADSVDSEIEANTHMWLPRTVKAVSGEMFTVEEVAGRFAIDAARIPAIFWFPGEKAEKVE